MKLDDQEPTNETLPKAINSDELRNKLSEINKRLKEPTKKQTKTVYRPCKHPSKTRGHDYFGEPPGGFRASPSQAKQGDCG